MGTIYGGTILVLWIAFTILTLILYHKVFTVYYFDLGAGLLKEIFFSAIIGALLAGLTLMFSTPVAIIIVIIGFLVSRKPENPSTRKFVLVLFIVMAGVIFFVGKRFQEESGETESATQTIDGTTGTEDISHSENVICGYDYNGNELYVGYVVRIGANEEGSKYAVGTIIGYDSKGTVQVEFTEIHPTSDFDQSDYYYIGGLEDEIESSGRTVRLIDAAMVQIYIFG